MDFAESSDHRVDGRRWVVGGLGDRDPVSWGRLADVLVRIDRVGDIDIASLGGGD